MKSVLQVLSPMQEFDKKSRYLDKDALYATPRELDMICLMPRMSNTGGP